MAKGCKSGRNSRCVKTALTRCEIDFLRQHCNCPPARFLKVMNWTAHASSAPTKKGKGPSAKTFTRRASPLLSQANNRHRWKHTPVVFLCSSSSSTTTNVIPNPNNHIRNAGQSYLKLKANRVVPCFLSLRNGKILRKEGKHFIFAADVQPAICSN